MEAKTELQIKFCKHCGIQLVKRKHESNERHNNKKFCSAKHARIWLKANQQGWWSPEAIKNRRDILNYGD